MKRHAATFALITVFGVLVLCSVAGAAIGPLYGIRATWGDTNLPPGGEGQFVLSVNNLGDADGSGVLVIADQLPAGVTVTNVDWGQDSVDELTKYCFKLGSEAKEAALEGASAFECRLPAAQVVKLAKAPGLLQNGSEFNPEPTGFLPPVYADVAVDPGASGVATNTASVSGGGAASGATDTDPVGFNSTPADFGIVAGSFESDVFGAPGPFGTPVRQAGARPFELRVAFDLNQETGIDSQDELRFTSPRGRLRDAEVTVPRGFIGNPEATPKCDPVKFATVGVTSSSTQCPPDTQIGYLNAWVAAGTESHGAGEFALGDGGTFARVPIYNLEPPQGVPSDFGFTAGGLVQGHIYGTLDPAQHYAIKTLTPDISSLLQVRGSQVTLWGVPGDPAHDKFRYYPEETEGRALGAPFGSAAIRPFITNPMDCGFANGGSRIRVDSYNNPGNFTLPKEYADPLEVVGCEDPRFRFEPDIAVQPTDRHAGAPTGLDVHLKVPQRNDEVQDAEELYAPNGDVKAIPVPPIKEAVVKLPEGMTLNPSAAQGLEGCSSEEIGLETDRPVKCPDASQYGTLILHTPILPADDQPEGHIYIAKQNDNPFQNFLTIYLVIEEPQRGILVKIPGRADLDPKTGQITTTFEDLPQFPVSDMQMTLKGGVRAGLVEPSTCGKKAIAAQFFSWQEPNTPRTVKSSYEMTEKLDGTPCLNNLGERQFRPSLEAGTTNNTAGEYSPFSLRLTRTDEDQEFSQLGVKLPEGLTGKLAGIAQCSDAAIAKAISRTGAGDGALEETQPSCPASSLIGTTDVGAGVGVPLTYVPGKVYLAGPYQGAPLSVVVITPAVVGPFDLGVIAVRTALRIDSETAQVTAVTDPFPQIFQGIPVRIRDIRLKLDRPEFTLNPTSCAEKQIDAHVTGTGGDVNTTADDTGADLSNRFQAADCASLGFHPHLAFRLIGGTGRGAHPKLHATVTYPKHGAYSNIAAASVALPHSEFLDQGHIKTVCTRVQFAAKACPAGSIYGHAVAKSPLFDFPLEGPVYLRSSSHALPDVVAALEGPASMPIEVDLDGRVDSVNGGIRNSFEVVPDAPVESFNLTLQGAKKGLLENSTDLCAGTHRATAKFTAQNGRRIVLRPAMRVTCSKSRHRGHAGRSAR